MDPQPQSRESAVGIALKYAEKSFTPKIVDLAEPGTGNAAPVLILPTGLQALDVSKFFDQYRDAPKRKKGTSVLTNIGSFIDLVNRTKDLDSVIFATESQTAPGLTAVFDYNCAEDGESGGAPRFGTHRAAYQFPLSTEWEAWTEACSKELSQAELAKFIEARFLDLTNPAVLDAEADKMLIDLAKDLGKTFAAPRHVLTVSRHFSVHEGQRATQKVNRDTGEQTFVFETVQEEIKDAENQTVAPPSLFLITIPIFKNGPAYRLAVHFRFRLAGSVVKFSFEMIRADQAFEDGFKELCAKAQKETDLPLFFGAPEQ